MYCSTLKIAFSYLTALDHLLRPNYSQKTKKGTSFDAELAWKMCYTLNLLT